MSFLYFRKQALQALKFIHPISRGAVVANEASKYFGHGNYAMMSSALPVYGIAASSLQLACYLTSLWDNPTFVVTKPIFWLYATSSAQLLDKSIKAYQTGSVALVYYGLAIQAGVRLVSTLHEYHEMQNNGHWDHSTYKQLEKTYQAAILKFTLEFAGWTLLATGNPAGAICLAISFAQDLYKLKSSYAPNLFNFSYGSSSSSRSKWEESDARSERTQETTNPYAMKARA